MVYSGLLITTLSWRYR